MQYPLLTWVMTQLLNPKFELDIFENRDFIYNSITKEIQTGLLNEIEAAKGDQGFSWLEMAFDTGWFHRSFRNQYDLVLLTDEEVFERFKLWVWYGICPETRYDEEHLWRTFITVYYILRDVVITEGRDWVSVDEIMQKIKSRDVYWAHLQRFHFEYIVAMNTDLIEYKRRLTKSDTLAFSGLSSITHIRLSLFENIDNFFKEMIVGLNFDVTEYPELNWPSKEVPLPIAKKNNS